MFKIAHMISGDLMIASVEDNYSDLTIAAMESIEGFHKKTGKTFDEMIDMKLFDQYTKTCLWTAKARKGIKLSERIPFRNKHVSIEDIGPAEDNVAFDVADTSSARIFDRVDAQDTVNTYDYKTRKLIKALEENPELMTPTGKIKVAPLAKKLGMSSQKVSNIIKYMEEKNGHN